MTISITWQEKAGITDQNGRQGARTILFAVSDIAVFKMRVSRWCCTSRVAGRLITNRP